MSVAHPFQRTSARTPVFARRRHRSAVSAAASPTADATTVVPGTRTPAGLPRDLVVDETGKPRRSVLLAAIMIRRGRSVAEISAATGLSADVVACLSKAV
jgi:hypothetical protein